MTHRHTGVPPRAGRRAQGAAAAAEELRIPPTMSSGSATDAEIDPRFVEGVLVEVNRS